MNVHKTMVNFKHMICIAAICASVLSIHAQESPTALCAQQPAQITEVDIITKEGTFKRPICYAYGPSIDISTEKLPSPLASYEDFKQIAEIQKHNPSVMQRPILPLNRGKERSNEVFYKSVHDAKHQRNPLIAEFASDAYSGSEKDFHIGHEVGHLQSSFVHANQMQIKLNKKTNNQEIETIQGVETLGLGLTLAVCALSYAVSGNKKRDSYKPLVLGAGVLGVGTYAIARYKGEQIARVTREEEFACDEFAVNSRNSPHEKLRVAEAGIRYMNRYAQPLPEYLRRMFFTSVHPSAYERMHRLRRMANEQKTMIELQPNITVSKDGFGLGLTVNIG